MPGIKAGFSSTFYVLQAVYALIVLAGLVMAVDTQRKTRRKRKTRQGIPKEPLLIYAVAGSLYVVLALLSYLRGFIPALPGALSMTAVMLSPFMLALQIAYLLRVVFPRSTGGRGLPPLQKTPPVGADDHIRPQAGKTPQQNVGTALPRCPQTGNDPFDMEGTS